MSPEPSRTPPAQPSPAFTGTSPQGSRAELIPVRLVPVETFGGENECCAHPGDEPCESKGKGLCDAVSAWSDCNRAWGHIYRFEDLGGTDARENGQHREPGDTLVVWVDPAEFQAFYERKFGDD